MTFKLLIVKKRWFLLVITLFSCFFCTKLVQAQTNKTVIVDENNNGIPYLCFKSVGTNQHLLSDVDGIITISERQFKPTDILQVESLFFENLEIQVKDFLAKDSIMLHNRSFAIEEVAVYSCGNLKDILKKLSRNFAEKYAKNYAAKMLHLRTVEANGKYREFCGYQGIFSSYNFMQKPVKYFWEDKNRMYAAPLTVMRSDPLMSNKDEKLTPYAVYGTGGINARSKNYLKAYYCNTVWQDPMVYKRSIEMYTPLNHNQLSNFDCTVADEYVNALNQRIVVIRFETKPEAYLRKTLIFGIGYLYYNSELEFVERVVMENHQDQYSMFNRWKISTLVNSATKHVVNISYCMEEEHIYTKSVSLDVRWVDPHAEEGFYHIKLNSRRNPLKYNLHEYEVVVFSKFVFLTKEKKKEIAPYLVYPAGFEMFPYIAAFKQEKWEKTDFPGINRDRLFKELNLKNRPLFLQAQENALDMNYYYSDLDHQHKKFIPYYYIQTRKKLYPLLYHEKY